jgi:hypothetical protein
MNAQHSMRTPITLLSVVLVFAVAGALSEPVRGQETQRAIGRSVLDGVYTSAQARRGEAQFQQHCASCHRRDLGGFSGPPLKGDRFLDQWREFPLEVLFDVVRTQMPMGNPGGLPASSYLDIAAFLLSANGLPNGADELSAERVSNVLLVAPGGPQPLPTSSPALIAGCMTKDLGTGWFLTSASDPVRTLDPYEFTDAELGAASQAAPGRELFRLQNLDELPGSTEGADRLVGRKVAAKGILVRQERGSRLNVATIAAVGDKCEP